MRILVMSSPSYYWPYQAQLAISIVVHVEEGAKGSVVDSDRGPEVVDHFAAPVPAPIWAQE
jgi:hypothetical protein